MGAIVSQNILQGNKERAGREPGIPSRISVMPLDYPCLLTGESQFLQGVPESPGESQKEDKEDRGALPSY